MSERMIKQSNCTADGGIALPAVSGIRYKIHAVYFCGRKEAATNSTGYGIGFYNKQGQYIALNNHMNPTLAQAQTFEISNLDVELQSGAAVSSGALNGTLPDISAYIIIYEEIPA